MASRLGALAGVTAAACGLADVFSSPGPTGVVLHYGGDTTLFIGVVVPTRVTALVSGVPVANPRLRYSSSDTLIIQLVHNGDSVVGQKPGRATISVWLESSILSDSLPTLAESLRVTGKPPPVAPARP